MRYFLAIIFSLTIVFAQTDEFEDEFDKKEIFDPLSGYNRVMTSINDTIYTYIFDPVLDGYRWLVPQEGREAIANIFDNALYPLRLINNLLQFKFQNAGEETLRFVANTIVGFAGVSDVATKYYKIPRHDEDFGQTLGYWGVGSGFHIVWPIFGPSNLRDTFGMVGDYFSKPTSYIEPETLELAVKTFDETNSKSLSSMSYKQLKKDAIDLYPFLRDTYEQRRNHLIKE
ncbi:MlaA family lipoprotein [Campylobacter mucosalis]|uniref:Lipid asymmetry ABC transporter MlaABCDEF, lipoprotein MlaA n=1 Tax=Campylobacter mucosalis CCUG 21559 TaxID=1032067 RepID=A0A6G5QEJ4_9BACT|nr:VacJ family lipoprotein [Campylobacter mucosalis]KEA45895.1 ABC transporter [Campylobacter mucosalis]QCD44072.1 lipid asymmetry ABC transporter MlaABCDEF, lipoprotein MlaA [Campylobacter mucosalis CCUG 21559]QKF62430.1 lipid asymmetry ABC transporter MlaABCDEF, lipoprotein MlaA [Campylobacter mucosalis]